jgi:hemolysin activation/secretion protein
MNPLGRNRCKNLLRQWALAVYAVMAGAIAFAQDASPILLDVKQYVIEGENPLSAEQTQAILAPHLGKQQSLSSIEAAAVALENALHAHGYSFHRVIVPGQRPTGGIVHLRILQFPLDKVTVTNNHYFTSANVLAALPSLKPGSPPAVAALTRELALANEHPAKRLAIHIKESQTPDHLDAEVRVRDAPSSLAFVSLAGGTRDQEDTINRNTGYTRLTVGYQNSNLFDRDHALTLAYTTSPDHIRKVTQLGAFYWIPFYGHNTTLNAFWTRSDVDTGSVGVGTQSFDVSGRGEFWGLRGTYALPKWAAINQQVSLGLENRYFESSLGAGGGALQTTPVGSRPLSLRYLARYEQAEGGIGGYLEYVSNLDGGGSNDAAAYAAARTGATQNWSAWRYGVDVRLALAAGWNLTGRLRGQQSSDALIPGEQFGLGGVGSVRGLRDRETSGDKGHSVNVEVVAPQFPSGLTPYVFWDFGRRSYAQPVAGLPDADGAASLGVGARWNWQRNLEVDATLAKVVDGISLGTTPATDAGHTKLNFSLFYRF